MLNDDLEEKYLEVLKKHNEPLMDAESLILYPGMEFQSSVKWWPDVGNRVTPHEGVDVCYFATANGRELVVRSDFAVPVVHGGRVISVCADYLGKTVFVEHARDKRKRFVSVYAHIVPNSSVTVGKIYQKGEIIGGLADTYGRKNRMPAHLHLSLMSVDTVVEPHQYTWDLICFSEKAELIDPCTTVLGECCCYPEKNHWKEELGLPTL